MIASAARALRAEIDELASAFRDQNLRVATGGVSGLNRVNKESVPPGNSAPISGIASDNVTHNRCNSRLHGEIVYSRDNDSGKFSSFREFIPLNSGPNYHPQTQLYREYAPHSQYEVDIDMGTAERAPASDGEEVVVVGPRLLATTDTALRILRSREKSDREMLKVFDS